MNLKDVFKISLKDCAPVAFSLVLVIIAVILKCPEAFLDNWTKWLYVPYMIILSPLYLISFRLCWFMIEDFTKKVK